MNQVMQWENFAALNDFQGPKFGLKQLKKL